MPDFLLELFSEEIPARMQARASEQLRERLAAAFKERELGFTAVESFVTPRRLTAHVTGLPAEQQARAIEKKGPRVGAPAAALDGFLRANNLASAEALEQRDTGKGVFYFLTETAPGAATIDLLGDVVRTLVAGFDWPKSMRWADGSLRWVRPLRRVLALFDGKTVPGTLPLGGEQGRALAFTDTTSGHRFLSPQPIRVAGFADYRDGLAKAHVVLDAGERRRRIADFLQQAASSLQLGVKEDPGLLDEVTGLVEWPVPLIGTIDAQFMDLPPEVLTTSMRVNQRYFALLTPEGKLANRFVLIANMVTSDGGKTVVAGNERVLRARLADAKFFWEQDKKTGLAAFASKLDQRVFHAKLGTVADRVARLADLARRIAPQVGADAALAERAAQLAKADLSSGMVGEFPELQGLMGRYYALQEGEKPEVADAIRDHYAPQGPNDRCPSAPLSVALALAEKIDALAGFFSIDEKPTGSKDPYALRRAGLGLLRLVQENRLHLGLRPLFDSALKLYPDRPGKGAQDKATVEALLAFLAERLRVSLREEGQDPRLIQAALAVKAEDDFLRLRARVDALAGFIGSESGGALLTAFRRAGNIIRIEEKKDGTLYAPPADPALFENGEEKRLFEALGNVRQEAGKALAKDEFVVAMVQFRELRAPVDDFFNHVTVNCDEPRLRANRLRLLSDVRDIFSTVADFSAIEG
jgi:glycyl-tRNA synthetase beta chain